MMTKILLLMASVMLLVNLAIAGEKVEIFLGGQKYVIEEGKPPPSGLTQDIETYKKSGGSKSQVVVGRSSQADVMKIMGVPDSVGVTGGGDTIWTYHSVSGGSSFKRTLIFGPDAILKERR